MNIRRIIFLILIIINCMVIFYFSNQVANASSNSSGRIVNIVAQIVPYLKNMPEDEKQIVCNEILQPIVRKVAHFSIYTMLGFWMMNFGLTYRQDNAFITWGVGTTYAITDEIHQFFIPGRSCELRDICIDSFGVLTGIMIAILTIKIIEKRTTVG